ncbi:MAG: hypothetical protein HKL90_05200 [Elusimicrobia bacterium]|nr:hypothetical protein [Elusimicrobiota bacterium]
MSRPRCSKPRGFTLVEALLALGLTAVLLATIYGLLLGGAGSWRRLRRRAEVFQTGRAALDQLQSDLQNSLTLSGGKLAGRYPFKGGASALSFPARLSVVDPASQPPVELPVVGVVGYAWAPTADGSSSSLTRAWSLLTADESPAYATSGEDEFPPLISSVTFSYPYQNASGGYPAIIWTDQWHQPERIPAAVRVGLVLTRADSGESVTLSKTIPIPQGMLGDATWVADARP